MRVALALSLCLLLTACGFHPQYGENRYTPVGAEDVLDRVEIANIPNREGQFLKNALIDRFHRAGTPTSAPLILQISTLQEQKTDLDVTQLSDATRGQLRLNTDFSLIRRDTGQAVLTRQVRAITSYNIFDSRFATRVAEDNARTNALNDLAGQIERQLVLYLKRGQN
jgi:LPS-assembly lipoprotein